MSELISASAGQNIFRQTLLTTVCSLALLTTFLPQSQARAEDADHPTIWIELGSQAERLGNKQQDFTPAFRSQFDYLGLEPVLPVQRPARYAIGGEVDIIFEPKGTDWTFNASLRYGRSNGEKHRYQVVPPISYPFKTLGGQPQIQVQAPPKHLNASAENRESHAIIDFQAGKEVGLGMMPSKSSSTFSFGLRFAQFASRRGANINGVPDFYRYGTSAKYPGFKKSHHRYMGTAETTNSFRGMGPSISWNASAPISGSAEDGGISIDWGVNAAVLFGRQKIKGETSKTGEHYKTHQEFTQYLAYSAYQGIASSYHQHVDINRSRNAVIPNVGGFAGFSLRFPNARVSLGYRIDYFFGAMDAGLETRKIYDRSFHGPFAAVSIGLGG